MPWALGNPEDRLEALREEFCAVKGQDRHFDRSWRQLQQRLHKVDEAAGREITGQLFLQGCGAQMLREATPTVAQDWRRMVVDRRGPIQLSAQLQEKSLLRATGGVGERLRRKRESVRVR